MFGKDIKTRGQRWREDNFFSSESISPLMEPYGSLSNFRLLIKLEKPRMAVKIILVKAWNLASINILIVIVKLGDGGERFRKNLLAIYNSFLY